LQTACHLVKDRQIQREYRWRTEKICNFISKSYVCLPGESRERKLWDESLFSPSGLFVLPDFFFFVPSGLFFAPGWFHFGASYWTLRLPVSAKLFDARKFFTEVVFTPYSWPCHSRNHARSQVLGFGGAKYIFRGQDFCFYYIYLYITNFPGRNTICGAQKIFGGIAPNFPVATGLQIIAVT